MNALEKALVAQNPELASALEENAWKRNIAMAIRRLRFEVGMSQQDVAAKAEMSQSHVAKIEAPYGGLPTLTTLKKYGKACGRDVLHLEFLTSDEFARRKGSIDQSDPMGSAADLACPGQSASATSAWEDRREAPEDVS